MKKFDPVTVYKEVLSGKRKRFPNYFWSYNNKFEYENAKQVTIYLIEQILKWDDKQIKKKLSRYTFRNNGLTGMLTVIFNGSAFSALDNAYPGRFHEWELSATPRNYWNLSTAKYATTWLIEEKLCWDDKQIKEKLSFKVFKENYMNSMATILFNGSIFKALDNAYPGRFHEWELSGTPKNYWNLTTAAVATRWLIEEKLHWSDEDIKKNLTFRTFYEHGFSGMIYRIFHNHVFNALDNAYPGKFHEWELSSTPRNYWNLNTAAIATRWLIEEKLHWSDEDIRNKISSKVFKQYGLYGMAINNFHGNTFKIIDNAYPGKFKKEELKLCRYKYC